MKWFVDGDVLVSPALFLVKTVIEQFWIDEKATDNSRRRE